MDWAASLRHILTTRQNHFADTHQRADYHFLAVDCDTQRLFVPSPNRTNHDGVDFPAEARHIPYWMFMNAAFLDTTCRFLWIQLPNLDRELVRTKLIPFVYGANHHAALADYNAIRDDARMNVYHTIMFLGTCLRWHPDDDVRRTLEQKFAERGVGVHTLRASLVRFVKGCLDDAVERIPATRIELGRRLDDVFRTARFPQAEEHKALYGRWPDSPAGHVPIHQLAHVSDGTGALEDYRVEAAFAHPDNSHIYTWNELPQIRQGNEVNLSEAIVLDSFFYAAMRRMLVAPGGMGPANEFPDFWPVLKAKGSNEAVEYVIIRPCIEHSMLGVILGRGGEADLGSTLWGQTELSCYDDSFHGVWSVSLLCFVIIACLFCPF